MGIILGIVPVIYILGLAVLYGSWRKLRSNPAGNFTGEKVCVIIPVRNEEKNITALLTDIDLQDYPANNFEVIVADDGSTDRTASIVREMIGKVKFRLNYLRQVQGDRAGQESGKKKMITRAIGTTEAAVILLTDGDCRVGDQWIRTMTTAFSDKEVHFAAGPVIYHRGTSFANNLLQLDLSGLLVTSAALIGLKIPVMGNGANMAYRKSSFQQSGGYSGNTGVASGDDSFIMHSIGRRFPGSIRFVKDRDALVYTSSPVTWKDFLHQRIRWSAKWKLHHDLSIKILAVFIFLVNLSFLLLAAWSVVSFHCRLLIVLMGLKMISECFLLKSYFRFAGLSFRWPAFIFASFFYSLYAVFFGILANSATFTWKGRTYKS